MIAAARGSNAVPFTLPARFLLTGAFALPIAFTLLAMRPELLGAHYAAPSVLAFVHILTLGFASLIYVGAMHQLMPVLLNAPLYSLRLGSMSFCLLAAGSLGVVVGFALGFAVLPLAAGGILAITGLLVFLSNILLTARQAPRLDSVSTALIASATYLTLTAGLGTLLVLGRAIPEITATLGYATPLHLGLGLFGSFFLAIAGAGHKLLGMFVLAHGVTQTRVRIITWLVHAALALLFLETALRISLGFAAGAVMVAAVATYLYDVRVIIARRARRVIERAMQHYLLAALFLPGAAGLALFGQTPAAAYAVLGGFITLAIAGMLVKIMSFLTWQHRYARKVGHEEVPMMRDMNRPALEAISLFGLGLGAILIVGAILWPTPVLATTAAALSAIGSWSLFAHLVWIVGARHRARPQQRMSREEPHVLPT